MDIICCILLDASLVKNIVSKQAKKHIDFGRGITCGNV